MTQRCTPEADGSCAICADAAAPATVLSLNPADQTARVRLGDEVSTVAVDLIEGVAPGDVLMIHLGFAIGRLDPAAS